jgi:hypothetical protein
MDEKVEFEVGNIHIFNINSENNIDINTVILSILRSFNFMDGRTQNTGGSTDE